MRRAAEDRAGAVIHQDEIGDIDRQIPGGVERVAHGQPGVKALLLGLFQRFLGGRALAAFGAESSDFGVVLFQRPGQRMVGRNAQEGRAEQGVGAGRIDLDPVEPLGAISEAKGKLQPARAADPVLLHQLDLGRPVIQPVDGVKQLFGHVGDAEEPLRQLAPLDLGARAPALAVLDLFVGQHRHVDRIPVDHGVLAINQTLIEEIQEQRLLLAVVLGVAGGKHPRPVEREAQRLHLFDHVVDVGIGPVLGVAAAGHGGIFGRHAEGVEAHRVQHVVAGGNLVTGDHVTHGVVAHMAHVQLARGVGEHLEHVVFRLAALHRGGEGFGLGPGLLPFRLDRGGIIARHMRVPLGVLRSSG